jgi:hypothetical protein
MHFNAANLSDHDFFLFVWGLIIKLRVWLGVGAGWIGPDLHVSHNPPRSERV